MEILLLVSILFVAAGLVTAGTTDNPAVFIVSAIAAGIASVVLFSSLFAVLGESKNKQDEKHKVICLQLPGAEWIDDLDACIQNGKVVKF